MPTYQCSAVVLTGDYPEASDAPIKTGKEASGNPCLLDYLLATVRPLVDEIIIVAEKPAEYLAWDALIVSPQCKAAGFLNSLFAGLFACRHPYALVAGCDRPVSQNGLAQALLSAVEPKWDAIVTGSDCGPELLPAVFSKRSQPLLQKFLETGSHDCREFIDRLRVKVIDKTKFNSEMR